jgi:hypothetical protein
MAELTNGAAVLHVRFEGRSVDIPLSDLDMGRLPGDGEVKQAVARYLDVSVDKFRHYVVDRHETGNLTVRPEAVFG